MNARLDEIEARAAAATAGPWYWEPPSSESFPQGDESLRSSGTKSDGYDEVVLSGWGYDACGTSADDVDRTFIAAARQDVPALVAALRAVLAVAERWVTRDGPHPSHDHLCPDWIATDIRAAITAALDAS